MKRCLLLIVLLAVVVSPAMGGNNLQTAGDFSSMYLLKSGLGNITWDQSTSAGNNNLRLHLNDPGTDDGTLVDSFTSGFTYVSLGGSPMVRYYNASGVQLASSGGCANSRITITVAAGDPGQIGNYLYEYCNGVQSYKTPTNLSWPISYYKMYANGIDVLLDDFGTSSETILGAPEDGMYTISYDPSGAGQSGVIRYDGVRVQDDLPVSYSKPTTALETANLVNAATGTTYVTTTTSGSTAYGTLTFDLDTLYSSGAPYGWYYAELNGVQSSSIYYMMGGAILYFDEDSYTFNDNALLTYEISDDYWEIGSTYRVAVYSATTGENIYSNTSIGTQENTIPFTFQEGISTGAYYAYLIKTTGSTTSNIGFDYTELDSFLQFYGYVKDQDDLPISGANVSIVQGDRSSYSTTPADGSYTSGTFYANFLTILNVTASGYSQYNVSLVPPLPTRVYLNFTLNTTTPTVTGMGIGGVARDGIFNDTTRIITSGYGRPLASATVYLWNFSTGQTYTKTTNNAGWYLCDDGSSCSLVPGRIYDVQGRKGGYNNSQNYTVVTS